MSFIVKTDNIYKLLQKMLKLDLICQIINLVDHYQYEKIKNDCINER